MKDKVVNFLKECKVLIIIFVLLFPLACIFHLAKVNGVSMYPTLRDNQYIISKNAFFNIKRNDIIIVKMDVNGKSEIVIKRVIGIPNDTIEIRDNVLYINDKEEKEYYIKAKMIDTNYDKITLGSDEYFVMGDNRNLSYDSRNVGAIKKKDIIGQLVLIIY